MITEFEKDIFKFKSKYFSKAAVEIIERYDFYIKLRIIINDKIFISIRYNNRTKRLDFALIRDNKRMMGFDNLGGWHKHPFKNPNKHIKCNKPSLKYIFTEFLLIINKL